MEKVENTTPTATKTNATDNAFKNGTIRRLIGSTKVKDLETVQVKGVVKNMSSTSPTTTPPRNKSAVRAISCHSNAKAKEESSWLSGKVDWKVPVFLNTTRQKISAGAKLWWLVQSYIPSVYLCISFVTGFV